MPEDITENDLENPESPNEEEKFQEQLNLIDSISHSGAKEWSVGDVENKDGTFGPREGRATRDFAEMRRREEYETKAGKPEEVKESEKENAKSQFLEIINGSYATDEVVLAAALNILKHGRLTRIELLQIAKPYIISGDQAVLAVLFGEREVDTSEDYENKLKDLAKGEKYEDVIPKELKGNPILNSLIIDRMLNAADEGRGEQYFNELMAGLEGSSGDSDKQKPEQVKPASTPKRVEERRQATAEAVKQILIPAELREPAKELINKVENREPEENPENYIDSIKDEAEAVYVALKMMESGKSRDEVLSVFSGKLFQFPALKILKFSKEELPDPELIGFVRGKSFHEFKTGPFKNIKHESEKIKDEHLSFEEKMRLASTEARPTEETDIYKLLDNYGENKEKIVELFQKRLQELNSTSFDQAEALFLSLNLLKAGMQRSELAENASLNYAKFPILRVLDYPEEIDDDFLLNKLQEYSTLGKFSENGVKTISGYALHKELPIRIAIAGEESRELEDYLKEKLLQASIQEDEKGLVPLKLKKYLDNLPVDKYHEGKGYFFIAKALKHYPIDEMQSSLLDSKIETKFPLIKKLINSGQIPEELSNFEDPETFVNDPSGFYKIIKSSY